MRIEVIIFLSSDFEISFLATQIAISSSFIKNDGISYPLISKKSYKDHIAVLLFQSLKQ
jgi:hypothetical protein